MHAVNLVARLPPCYQDTALLATALLPGYPLAPLYRESSGEYTIRLRGLELVPGHYVAPRFRVCYTDYVYFRLVKIMAFSLRVLEILETLELYKSELLLLFAL